MYMYMDQVLIKLVLVEFIIYFCYQQQERMGKQQAHKPRRTYNNNNPHNKLNLNKFHQIGTNVHTA